MFDKIGEFLRGNKPETPKVDPVDAKLAEADAIKRDLAAKSAYQQVDSRTRLDDQRLIEADKARLAAVEHELQDLGHMKLPSTEGVTPVYKRPFEDEKPQEMPPVVPTTTAPDTEEKVA